MLYNLHVEYRDLAVLRLRLLKDITKSEGIIPIEDFMKVFRCIVKFTTLEFEETFINIIKYDNENISYYKLCDIIDKFQYRCVYVKYSLFKYRKTYDTICPYRVDEPIVVAQKEQSLDVIIDYVWCRLSEKFIKLSKAFRSMDISMVLCSIYTRKESLTIMNSNMD